MFGPLGGFEIIVLVALGLLIFGPRRLPEIGRTMGRAMSEFRKAATELRTSIEREIDLEDVKRTTKTLRSEMTQGLESLDPSRPGEEEPRTIRRNGPGGAKAAPKKNDRSEGDRGADGRGPKEGSSGSEGDGR